MILHLQAKPGSRKEGLHMRPDGVFILKIAAPATEGKANKRIVEWLSGALGLPPSYIQILKGKTSAHKTVAIQADAQWVYEQLKAIANPA